MNPVGEPDAGNLQVRFDERGGETERLPQAQATAPLFDSTRRRGRLRSIRARRCGFASSVGKPPPGLQRPDLDLAELHHAGAVLKRNVAPRMLAVGRAVDGAGAVEDHGECRPLGGDVIGVPLVGGLEEYRRLGDIDDRPGAVGRVGTLVENVDLSA
jgi:hypothetical protein